MFIGVYDTTISVLSQIIGMIVLAFLF